MNSLFLRGGALAAVLLGLTLAFVENSEPTAGGRPDILLVTLDTTRTDHTSAYGYERPTTPRLAALAADGVRFEAAYAPMATTLPAHASLFTAELPRTLGVTKNGVVLGGDHETLAERLRAAGYSTAAFVSSFPVDRQFGLAQGFDQYDDDFRGGGCPTGIENWEGFEIDRGFCRRGRKTTERALHWLAKEGHLDEPTTKTPPFFLWVHYFDAHAPYRPAPEDSRLFPSPSKEWLSRKTAAYDAEIHYADRAMGELIEVLASRGKLDDTVVVVAADHGEGLMQHGHMHHSLLLYEEDVRVPLIVRWPAKVPGGRSILEPVQLADLTPTLLEIAGLPGSPQGVGVSLAPALLDGARLDPDRNIFLQRREYTESIVSGHPVRGEKLGLRQGRWKYIEAREEGSVELYDLETDPQERTNLARRRSAERSRLAGELHRWQTENPRPALAAVKPEAEERLRALGYVP